MNAMNQLKRRHAFWLSLSTLCLCGCFTTEAFGVARQDRTLLEAETRSEVRVFTSSESGFLVNSVLVSSDGEGVLIDAQFTRSEAKRVADAIEQQAITLKAVYVTHGHPDHAFGLEVFRQRFPEAKVLAHPDVVEHYSREAAGKLAQWKPVYGDDLTDVIVPLQTFQGSEFKVGRDTLEFIRVGQGDTHSSVAVRVRSSNTLIAGDVVYDGVHPWLAETNEESRAAWLGTLQALRRLNPARLIAGHQKQGATPTDGAHALHFMETYLTRFDALRKISANADALQRAMLEEFADRDLALPVILQISAQAAFPN